MNSINLKKYHGLGNEFLIAVASSSRAIANTSKVAKELCDPSTGLGADGLIFGVRHPDPAIDIQMILFNADGSRAEISGNGVRCLAHEMYSEEGAEMELHVLTDAGVRETILVSYTEDIAVIEVNMGEVKTGPSVTLSELGIDTTFGVIQVGTADVGNPHFVVEVDDLKKVSIEQFGLEVESAWNRDGINVHVLQVQNPQRVSLLTWERGVGVTAACGSGAIAAAYLAREWNRVDDSLTVSMPGGDALVSFRNQNAFLQGESVCIGEFTVPIRD